MTLENILEDNEKVLWEGKANYKKHMAKMYAIWFMTFAMVLLPASSMLIGAKDSSAKIKIVVLIMVIGVLTYVPLVRIMGKKSYNNILYAFTDKRIIIQHGFFAPSYASVEYGMISNINVHVGYLDKKYSTGSISLMSNARVAARLDDIETPYEVFKLVKKIHEEQKTSQR